MNFKVAWSGGARGEVRRRGGEIAGERIAARAHLLEVRLGERDQLVARRVERQPLVHLIRRPLQQVVREAAVVLGAQLGGGALVDDRAQARGGIGRHLVAHGLHLEVDDDHELVDGVVVEVEAVLDARLEPRVGDDHELVHLLLVAREDEGDGLAPLVVHHLHHLVDRLPPEVGAPARHRLRELVRLVHEEDAAARRLDVLGRLGRRLVDEARHQVALLHLDDLVLGGDAQPSVQLRHQPRDGRLAHARVAREHHVPDRFERLVPLLPAAQVERQLLAQPAHVLLDALHSHQLAELLLHLLLRRLELLLRERLRLWLVLVAVVLRGVPAGAASRRLRPARSRLGRRLEALLQVLRPLRVLDALVAQCLQRDRVLLILGRSEQVLCSLDVLLDGLLIPAGVVVSHRLVGDLDPLVAKLRHVVRLRLSSAAPPYFAEFAEGGEPRERKYTDKQRVTTDTHTYSSPNAAPNPCPRRH